jgi:hypothetical protein
MFRLTNVDWKSTPTVFWDVTPYRLFTDNSEEHTCLHFQGRRGKPVCNQQEASSKHGDTPLCLLGLLSDSDDGVMKSVNFYQTTGRHTTEDSILHRTSDARSVEHKFKNVITIKTRPFMFAYYSARYNLSSSRIYS